MHDFTFYVGSTASHRAHLDDTAVAYLAQHFPGRVTSYRVWGVWDGQTEDVAVFAVADLTDRVASRVAVALAALTGNDCVLYTRPATVQDDTRSLDSTAHYRARWTEAATGNRTLLSQGDPDGLALTRDVTGSLVAVLAWQNGTLSAVSE